jgi:hypothetical protein
MTDCTHLHIASDSQGDIIVTEPQIDCPNCKTEVEITKSSAAPLIKATRLPHEKKIADKDSAVAKREQDSCMNTIKSSSSSLPRSLSR